MMRRCALLVLLLAARHGFALYPNRRLSQYGHSAWRIQDGFLPGPAQQFGLAQTGDGYLWISTRSDSLADLVRMAESLRFIRPSGGRSWQTATSSPSYA